MYTSFQVISESFTFSVLAEGRPTPESNLVTLCVSFRLSFGLCKTKTARHSGFWALHHTASMVVSGSVVRDSSLRLQVKTNKTNADVLVPCPV